MRVTVACVLLATSAATVVLAVAASTAVGAAAALAVLAGVVAARMTYSEVLQTRRAAAQDRATQARAFGAVVRTMRVETATATSVLGAGLLDRDRRIVELASAIRFADKRALAAEARAAREARRADDAQRRLSGLLDQVLTQQVAETKSSDATDTLPSVVDLLAWEARSGEAKAESGRRQA